LPVIVLTKRDLCADYSEQAAMLRRAAATVEVIAVSAKTGEGLEGLAPYLGRGKTVVLLGSSGVGKSSLVNALAGAALMAVSEIREEDSRGRHTTTHRQLIALPDGTLVIDTPGMRELGMWRADEGLLSAFSDVEEHLGQCRFSDCRHETEPGCAIRAAIASGELAPERWQAYQKLRAEADAAEDMAARMAAKRAWQKSISRLSKQAKKSGDIRH
jgi:ribosome biogenesis GTPase